MVHISVDIHIQHLLSQRECYEGPIDDKEDVNNEEIVNFEEEDLIPKLYEEVIREDFESVFHTHSIQINKRHVVL